VKGKEDCSPATVLGKGTGDVRQKRGPTTSPTAGLGMKEGKDDRAVPASAV